jgi:hypothetical protein
MKSDETQTALDASVGRVGLLMKKLPGRLFTLICLGVLAEAQSPAPPQPSNQITPQVLGEMLRSATTFHELVRNLNLSQNLGPDTHTVSPDGVSHHSIERTAATVGAGAGAGAAIGGMTRKQNGVLIGALIGGAGGLILDEILKHREQTHPKPVYAPGPEPQLVPRQ